MWLFTLLMLFQYCKVKEINFDFDFFLYWFQNSQLLLNVVNCELGFELFIFFVLCKVLLQCFCSEIAAGGVQPGYYILLMWCKKKKCIYLILTLIKAWMVVLVPGVEPPSVWVTDHNPISLFFNRTICVFFWASFRPPRARQHHECAVQKTTWWLLLKAQGWNPFFFSPVF